MSNSPTFGHVNADARSFRDGAFRPINTSHGVFHPDIVLGAAKLDATLPPLGPGEFFEVLEEIDKTEGLRGTRGAGNFLNYRDAYAAAAGLGVQGGRAMIVIISPVGTENITALDENGQEVVVATVPQLRTVPIFHRLVFVQPWNVESGK
ncbi:hypothetical protein [Arthrobacter sp. A2-55]|uniref:hypothetical protein n=1 Tax=Arthrobacter sp. A2-55 TaxID=2897337 RepID=UPI0021CDCDBB|nr:hypothetical protein [Arthrobacter sp. A2-55]MCU6481962.1 hypothetical protein [Arthrobacter sp. A2-55]